MGEKEKVRASHSHKKGSNSAGKELRKERVTKKNSSV